MRDEQYNPFSDRELRTEQGIEPEITEFQPKSRPVKPWLERLKGVGILGLFFVVQTFASIIFVILLNNNPNIDSINSLDTAGPALKNMFTGMVISESIFIIGMIIYYNKIILYKLRDAFKPFLNFVIKLVAYYALLWTATVFFSVIDSVLFPQFIAEAGSNQDVIEAALLTPSIPMIISICLTAPIVEEFVFRYGLIKKLLYGVNRYVAAVIAALIFSFAHIGFSQMADLGLFIHLMLGYIGPALVFGYIYVHEDNIVYPIAIHIINNVQAVIIITMLANLV